MQTRVLGVLNDGGFHAEGYLQRYGNNPGVVDVAHPSGRSRYHGEQVVPPIRSVAPVLGGKLVDVNQIWMHLQACTKAFENGFSGRARTRLGSNS